MGCSRRSWQQSNRPCSGQGQWSSYGCTGTMPPIRTSWTPLALPWHTKSTKVFDSWAVCWACIWWNIWPLFQPILKCQVSSGGKSYAEQALWSVALRDSEEESWGHFLKWSPGFCFSHYNKFVRKGGSSSGVITNVRNAVALWKCSKLTKAQAICKYTVPLREKKYYENNA